jgi:hypothetical protein
LVDSYLAEFYFENRNRTVTVIPHHHLSQNPENERKNNLCVTSTDVLALHQVNQLADLILIEIL